MQNSELSTQNSKLGSARYSIRRLRLSSALRVSLALGWLVALCPAVCMAALAVQALRALGRGLSQIQSLDITILGQKIATIDPLALLSLQSLATSIQGLVARLPVTFALLTLALTLVGALVFLVVGLLFTLGYNLLARVTGGLEIELRERLS